jgi:hypothetical protein
MGSVRVSGRLHQPRYFNVMFASEPSKSLRTYLRASGEPNPWDRRHERGEVVQHKNWLIARGMLVEEGGLTSESAGDFRLYREGKGLCAVFSLAPDLHVFQVGDTELFRDTSTFIASLSIPVTDGNIVRACTSGGENIVVNLSDMSIQIDGKPSHDWMDQLYAGEWLFAKWDGGRITLHTDAEEEVFSDENLQKIIRAFWHSQETFK